MHGMMDRVMPGLKDIFLNGNNGHPLLHKTCPGDRHLTKELLSIVEDFEKAIGEEIVNAVIFDGEGCGIDVFRAFDRLNEERKNKFYLSNANRRQKGEDKEEYTMRCALVKKENGKHTVIATTAPNVEVGSGYKLADLYYNRWPCQEAKFKEMAKYCNLKVNHGFKKIETIRDKISDLRGDVGKLKMELGIKEGELVEVEAKYQNKRGGLGEKESGPYNDKLQNPLRELYAFCKRSLL
jgi:hypothetical protein